MGLYLIDLQIVLYILFKSEVSTKEVVLMVSSTLKFKNALGAYLITVTFKIQSSLNATAGFIPRVAPYAKPKMERTGLQNGHKV